MKRDIVLLLCVAIFYVLPVFWQVRDLRFRLDSDYDSALPILTHIVESAQKKFFIPFRFPYLENGISIIGDPLSFVLNPLITVPTVLFGVQNGLRIVIFFIVFLSGVSMAFFLSKLGVAGFVRLWASVLYLTSGALGARIAAGHIEKVLSFPFIPLFFYFILDPSMNMTRIFGAASTLTFIIFSGDFYMAWFLSIFFFIIKLYYFVTKREPFVSACFSMMLVYILFFVLSAVKLLPLFIEILPNMERFGRIDPYIGSVQILFFLFPFIVPFRMIFYDRPVFQRLFGFYFNWYEYYAFISPLAFLFLLKIKSLLSHKVIALLLILLGIGALYSALKYPYSPFYWLFHFVPAVRVFRVPQRIFSPMTSLVIGLLALCAQRWRKKIAIVICALSIVWTFFAGQQTMLLSFEQPRTAEAATVHVLRQKDRGNFFVVTFVCCMQTFLVEEHIPILNYYYGWRLKNVPDFETDMSQLNVVRPRYIIAPKRMNFSMYPYKKYFETDIANVWRTTSETIVPSL